MKPNFILKSFWLILIMLSVGVYSNASEGAKPSSMMELPPCGLETTLASYNWYVYYTFDAGDGAYLLMTGDSIIRYQFNPNFSVGQYYLQPSGGFLVDDYTYDWSVNADCALVLTTSFGTVYTGVPYGEGFIFPGLSNMALLPMTPTVPGCTDPAAPNYWPSAIVDDGSCLGENIAAFEAQRALDHDWYFTNTCGNFVANFEAYLYFQTVEYNYGFQNGSRTVVFDTDYSAEIYASETGNGWRTEYYFPTSLVTATFGNWFVHNWSLNDPGLIDLPSTLSFKINATGDTLTSLSGCWQVVKNPFGCTDPSAVNYRAAASVDNGTCYYAITEAQLTAEPWAATADAMYELPIFSSVITNTDAASKVRDYMAYASSADSATVMTFNADYTGLLNWKPSVVGAPSDYSNQYQYSFTWTLVDGKITVDFGYSLSPAPVDMYIDSNNQLVVMAHSVYAIFSNDNKIAAPTRTYFGSRFTQGNSLACSVTGACNYNPDDFLNPNTFPFDGLCTFPESIEGYDCTGCTVTEEVSGAYDVYVVGFGPTGQTLTLDGGINFNVGTAVQPLNADSRGGTATGTFLTAGQSWVQTCGRIDFLTNSGGYFNSGSLTYDATNGYWSGSSSSTSNPSNQWQQIIVVPAGSTIGCSNPNACNYDPSADVLVSIGCEMPMIGRDCDGNCIVTLDIAGTVWDSYEATNGPGGLVIGNMLTAGVLNFDASGNELGENFGTGMTWSQNCAIVSITNGTNTYNLFLADSYTLVYQNWNPVTFQVELQVFKLPFVEVLGCIDNTACNYDASANTDDGSCTYPSQTYLDCSGDCLNDINLNGICDELEVTGCMQENACNYDPTATLWGPCTFPTDAAHDCDGNCIIPNLAGMYDWYYDAYQGIGPLAQANAIELLSNGSVNTASGVYIWIPMESWSQYCSIVDFWSSNPDIYNFSGNANLDGVIEFSFGDLGSNPASVTNGYLVPAGQIPGCTDVDACNYNPNATVIAGNPCTYPTAPGLDCDGNCAVNNLNYSIWDAYTSLNGEPDLLIEAESVTIESDNTVSGSFFVPGVTWTQDCMQIYFNYSGGTGYGMLQANGNITLQLWNPATSSYDEYVLVPSNVTISGCTDPSACNFNYYADVEDNSCIYTPPGYNCDGTCASVNDMLGVCWSYYSWTGSMTFVNAGNYSFTDPVLGSLIQENAFYIDATGHVYGDDFAGWQSGINNSCTFLFIDNFAQSSDGYLYFNLAFDGTHYFFATTYTDINTGLPVNLAIMPGNDCVIGCTSTYACNYDPNADFNDNSSCVYPIGPGYDCDGVCTVDAISADQTYDLYAGVISNNSVVIDALIETAAVTIATDNTVESTSFMTGSTWTQDCGHLTFNDGTNTYDGYIQLDGNIVVFYWDAVANETVCHYLVPSAGVSGCTDNTACNYDATATIDDSSCTYANPYEDCSGNCLNDTNNNGTCDELELAGCTDNTACNYVSTATLDDGSCTYANPYEDCSGNCLNDTNNNGTCDELELAGCTDNTACNYVSTATLEDGSCTYANPYEDCSGNCLNDTNNNGTCDELEVSGCTDSFACNYDATATLDNGSCVYQSLVYYVDNDGDGYGAGDPGLYCSNPGAGYSTNGTDCNDGNAAIHPNAPEICGNNIDNDCDGQIDENCGGNGPANDERQNATTVNPTQYPFCSNTSGTCLNANGNDVWYQFVAQTQAARIAVTSVLNNVVLSVENEAGDQVLVSEDETAVGQEIAIVGGLTPGSIYFIRIENVNVATAGNFVMCVQHIPMSDPDNGTSFDNLCGYIKADWTGAQLYSATFTDASNNDYTGSSAQTFLPFSTFGGLQYGQTYSVVFNCTYILNDAGGNPNTVVTTSPAYTITIAEPASIALRSSDRCPTTRNIGSFIGTDRAICGATGYEWEFTLADEFGNAISLESIVVAVNTNSRYIRTTSISGVQPGDHYLVRVRPLFSYGPGSYGSSQMLCIAGSAGMTTEGDNVTPSLTGVNAERSVKLYPNPNNGEMINIQLTGITSETVQVNVIDALGRVIVSNQYSVNNTFNGTILFDTKLSSGMYNVQIIDGEAVMTERVIIK